MKEGKQLTKLTLYASTSQRLFEWSKQSKDWSYQMLWIIQSHNHPNNFGHRLIDLDNTLIWHLHLSMLPLPPKFIFHTPYCHNYYSWKYILIVPDKLLMHSLHIDFPLFCFHLLINEKNHIYYILNQNLCYR